MTKKERYTLIGATLSVIVIGVGIKVSQASATAHQASLSLIDGYHNLPPRKIIATVNATPITNRMVTRYQDQNAYAAQISNVAVPSLTQAKIIHILADQLALYQAAKAMGIHVSNSKALTMAIQQEEFIENSGAPIGTHLKNLRKELGESVAQYAKNYEEKTTKMLLTVEDARKKIESQIPQGSMTQKQWVSAQQQAVINWQNKVIGSENIIMK